MENINLQIKTTAQIGKAEKYWFENNRIGLKKTLFHRIYVPLVPFNSGLDYVEQPENTEIVIEWLKLDLANPDDLDGLVIKSQDYKDLEASIYIGSAHNPCEILILQLHKTEADEYRIICELKVNFEFEGVAKDELFKFETNIKYEQN